MGSPHSFLHGFAELTKSRTEIHANKLLINYELHEALTESSFEQFVKKTKEELYSFFNRDEQYVYVNIRVGRVLQHGVRGPFRYYYASNNTTLNPGGAIATPLKHFVERVLRACLPLSDEKLRGQDGIEKSDYIFIELTNLEFSISVIPRHIKK